MPQSRRSTRPDQTGLSPDTIVSRALQAVPVVKYALALAAISILFAIARGAWADVGIVGMFPLMGGILALMLMLIIVAIAGENRRSAATPALIVVWAISLAFVVLLGMTISAIAFGEPRNWARLILPKEASDRPLVDAGPVDATSKGAPKADGGGAGSPMQNAIQSAAASPEPVPTASPPVPKKKTGQPGRQTDSDNKPVSDAKLNALAKQADKLYADMRRANPIFRAHNTFVFSRSEVNEGWLNLHFQTKRTIDPAKWNSELFASWADDIMCGPDLSDLTAQGLQVQFMFEDPNGFSDSFQGLMCNFD